MLKLYAVKDGKDVLIGKVPIRNEWELSGTGKTFTIAYGKFPISMNNEEGFITVTGSIKNPNPAAPIQRFKL